MHTDIDISNEQEGTNGWTFDVHVGSSTPASQGLTLKLSFADYNHWSASGTDAPSTVARAVVAFMLDRLDGDALPACFDAATARRRFSDADAVIPTLIRE